MNFWDIYSLISLHVVTPITLVVLASKVRKHRHESKKKSKKAPLPKYISGTGLEKQVHIGTVTSGGYGSPVLDVKVNIRSVLDDNLEQVVSREATGTVLTVSNITSEMHGYNNDRYQRSTKPIDIKLSVELTDKLQQLLCHASVEQSAIERGF